jgi:hypothetical protein
LFPESLTHLFLILFTTENIKNKTEDINARNDESLFFSVILKIFDILVIESKHVFIFFIVVVNSFADFFIEINVNIKQNKDTTNKTKTTLNIIINTLHCIIKSSTFCKY